jgi:type III secretion protein V
MEEKYSELTKEVQRALPLQKITDVLRRLVSEGISIRNLTVIMESLIEWGQKEKDYVLLAEYVRTGLKRYISYKYTAGRNVLPAYMLDEDLEERIRGSIRQTSAGSYLAVEPAIAKRIIDNARATVGDLSKVEHKPVIITALDIRRYVRKLIEGDLYDLSVVSFQELTQEIIVQPVGRINL